MKQFGVTCKTSPKTKTISCSNEATDFHEKEISKIGCIYICLSVVLVGFIPTQEEIYYLEVPLTECKDIEKEEKSD